MSSAATITGLRGVHGTPDYPRFQSLKCPACGRPFAEGVFGPGTRVLIKCSNRRCIGHQKETMIAVYPAAEHGAAIALENLLPA